MAATQSTQTTLSAQTVDQGGRTTVTLAAQVLAQDGSPATGAVVFEDQAAGAQKPLAASALNAKGKAQVNVTLPPGDHALRAVYQGDTEHRGSASALSGVHAMASTAPGFTISVNPATITLTAGQSGTVLASVTPVNASALSSPMFVTLSCSGFPDQSSCVFTPENVEILPNATAAVTSSMALTTQAESYAWNEKHESHPVAWAILLPGTLGLAGIAFGARRRCWLSRLSMIALLGLVSTLGTTACAARYNYYHHGPAKNLPTPPGTYTLLVTAQSSNGITATTESTNFVLTVQ